MRLAIKRFSAVTGPMYKLLSNQNAAHDRELTTQLQNALTNFVNVLDEKGGVLCRKAVYFSGRNEMIGPVLYRMRLGLKRWRGFDLEAEFSRLDELVRILFNSNA